MPVPSLRYYLELPITVQHSFDAYPAVDAVIQDLEIGQFYAPALLADACFTDDRVSACIATRMNAIFGLPMEFKYQGQDTEREQSVDDVDQDAPAVLALKQHIVEDCQAKWEQMFPRAAIQQAYTSGILLNAGLGELEWGWANDGSYVPTLKDWNSQFLYWRWDTRSYWLNHVGGTMEIHPAGGKWVLFSPYGHNHGWLASALRSLGPLWLDRRFAAKDWARASEKWALGVVKGFVPQDAPKEEKDRFLNSLRNLPSDSTISCPVTEDSKFDVEVVKTDAMTGWDNFKERFRSTDDNIAILFLGQNLTTSMGQTGSGGSRAAAQVHDNVRADYLKNDVEIISSVLKTQVLKWWVHYNWAEEAMALGIDENELIPNVTWKVTPAEDKQKQAAAWLAVAQAVPNLAGTPVDIRAFLEGAGVPVTDKIPEVTRPPPGGDVNERPQAPDQELPGPFGPYDPNAEEPAPDTDPVPTMEGFALAQRGKGGPDAYKGLVIPKGLKRGARAGQLYADDLAESAIRRASLAMKARRDKLAALCKRAKTFHEVRDGVKRIYGSSKTPKQLRILTEKAWIAAELTGMLASQEDTRAA